MKVKKNEVQMAKKQLEDLPGGKKKIKSKNGKKTYLTTYLPGVKRRKVEEKWQKNLLEDLSGEKRRQIRVNMAKNTYWRTSKGGKKENNG